MSHHPQHHASPEAGIPHGSLKSYIIGFILSIILTVIPYVFVSHGTFSSTGLLISILAFAIVQLIVQLIFFLHLSTRSDQRWNLMAFIFILIIIAILLVGGLWIMHAMMVNMMPPDINDVLSRLL